MEILVLVLGGLAVFVVAAVSVGRVTANLARDPSRMIYDVEHSVEFVAEALPSEVTAELSYDDVTTILRLFHDYMHQTGVSTTAGEDETTAGPMVVDVELGAEQVIRRAAHANVRYRMSDVLAVIEAQMAYFEAIGVIGEVVDEPSESADEGNDEAPESSSSG